MQSRLSILVNMVRAADLDLIEHYSKSNRICAEVRAKNGVKTTFMLSNSRGSDPRGDLNEQSRIRRFAVANGGASVADVMPVEAKTAAVVPPAPKPTEVKPAAIKDKPRQRITMKNMTTNAGAAALATQAQAPAVAVASKAAQELTPIEFYKLCEYVKQTDLTRSGEFEVAVMRSTDALGCAVSESAFREAMQAVGKTEPDDWTKVEEPHVVVARELLGVMVELGHNPSLAFIRLMNTFGKAQA
jgi:hypothetical protein